jgi:hypothetical protein
MTMTPEVQTLHAKLSSKEWRMDSGMYLIRNKNGVIEPFRPNQAQRKFRKRRHNRNKVPKARQLGMSTFIVIDYLDTCLFPPLDASGKPVVAECGHIDLTQANALKKLAMAKRAWDEGPNHPDPNFATLWRQIHKANPLIRETTGLLQWSNGCRQEAGVSFTGTTPFRLHLSEFGPISAQNPAKASQIMTGPMNAVPMGGIIDVETTMEGGQYGECWQLFELAKKSGGNPETELDWMLHFFSWLESPEYDLPGRAPNKADTIEYFAGLEKSHGLTIPPSRQAWYEKIKATLGEKIYNQFPTVIDELSRVNVPGQIFPQMASVRAEGRVCRFNPEKGYPLFTSWDLGSSDNSAGWLEQPAGKAHNFLDWCTGEGEGAAGIAMMIRHWESIYGPIEGHLVPHDVEITDKGSGKTFLAQLVECGIPRNKIIVVPRIPDYWVGIDEVRAILPNCWFHERCDEPIETDTGAKLPGGVGRLEGYRKKIDNSTGIARDVPVKDLCDHVASALRTYAEALARNLVRANIRKPGAATVVSGFRGPTLMGAGAKVLK